MMDRMDRELALLAAVGQLETHLQTVTRLAERLAQVPLWQPAGPLAARRGCPAPGENHPATRARSSPPRCPRRRWRKNQNGRCRASPIPAGWPGRRQTCRRGYAALFRLSPGNRKQSAAPPRRRCPAPDPAEHAGLTVVAGADLPPASAVSERPGSGDPLLFDPDRTATADGLWWGAGSGCCSGGQCCSSGRGFS